MSYTALAVLSVALVVAADLWLLRTRLIRRADFWTAYAIMVTFQLVTNGILTGREVVNYADDTIIGTGNDVAPPTMFAAGRLFYAPFEDLLFGFSMILLTLSLWIFWGRRGLQRTPFSGPPRWSREPGG